MLNVNYPLSICQRQQWYLFKRPHINRLHCSLVTFGRLKMDIFQGCSLVVRNGADRLQSYAYFSDFDVAYKSIWRANVRLSQANCYRTYLDSRFSKLKNGYEIVPRHQMEILFSHGVFSNESDVL